jgi:hypothetical protein
MLVLFTSTFPLALYPQFWPWPISMKFSVHFGLLDLRHLVGLLGRVISSLQGLYLYTNTGKRAYTYRHQTSMPWVGSEPMILASDRAKTVRALDRSATLTGVSIINDKKFKKKYKCQITPSSMITIQNLMIILQLILMFLGQGGTWLW